MSEASREPMKTRARKRIRAVTSSGSEDRSTTLLTSMAKSRMDRAAVRMERLALTQIRKQKGVATAGEGLIMLNSDTESVNFDETIVPQKRDPEVPRRRGRPPSTGDQMSPVKARWASARNCSSRRRAMRRT